MKNYLFLALFAAGLTFTSCEKCQTCTIAGIDTEYCSKDKDANDAFKTSCEQSGGTIK